MYVYIYIYRPIIMKYLNIYNGIIYICNYIMDMYLYNYIYAEII